MLSTGVMKRAGCVTGNAGAGRLYYNRLIFMKCILRVAAILLRYRGSYGEFLEEL